MHRLSLTLVLMLAASPVAAQSFDEVLLGRELSEPLVVVQPPTAIGTRIDAAVMRDLIAINLMLAGVSVADRGRVHDGARATHLVSTGWTALRAHRVDVRLMSVEDQGRMLGHEKLELQEPTPLAVARNAASAAVRLLGGSALNREDAPVDAAAIVAFGEGVALELEGKWREAGTAFARAVELGGAAFPEAKFAVARNQRVQAFLRG